MHNTEEIKKRIIALLQNKGPSLPVQISKEIRMDTLIVSAFLSELIDSKKIIISNLRVGGTHLYLLAGQEPMLENFQQYLHPKEQEALQLLKNSKILKDSEQDPAIRVALRSIKDFSFSFKKDEELYWRYLTISEDEVKNMFETKIAISREDTSKKPLGVSDSILTNKIKQQNEIAKVDKEIKKEDIKIEEAKAEEKEKETIIEKIEPAIEKEEKPIKEQKKKTSKKQEILPTFENPLALKPKEKPEKIKPKSDFVEKIIKFLEKNDFKILEEKGYSKKEYNCISQINTDLGPIDFLTQAKDKKSISDTDLDVLLRQAQTIPLPALILFPGTLNKKAQEYSQKYYSILKTKKIAP